jgi:uncharacterized protein YdhG (YjbR/CyaY superfamily)
MVGAVPTPIDEHLQRFDGERLATLQRLHATLRKVLPTAVERISYRMPCFAVEGKAVAMFDGFADHCSYFPGSGTVLERVEVPAWCTASKGGLQFPIGRTLPTTLVRSLVRARLDEISDVRDGKRMDFFDDGRLKAVGSMKGGELHGRWRWFRQDGSLMRTGGFRVGEPVGVWETWDLAGNLVKATRR